ncbi:MAG: hypothetical protein IPP47_04340 [Bryobacterales bacterium]|nr:hypothetical protein [Bryobacterales bacterium]
MCGLLAAFGVQSSAQVINPLPARVFGQYELPRAVGGMVSPPSVAPNLLDGRKLSSPQSVAVDSSSSPAVIYVVDAGNNRVLGWKDYNTYSNGAPADIVLGQKDFQGSQARTGAGGLYAPASVAVDSKGNVFVVDAGNNRVVRYPTPAAPRDDGAQIVADLVIGQADLNANTANLGVLGTVTEAGLRTNASTTQGVQAAGIAFDGAGNLWVADAGNHRILRYLAADVSGPSNTGPNGGAVLANYVLGQAGFTTAVANPARPKVSTDRINKQQLRFPNSIAFDRSGNLFAIDDLGRVVVYQPPFETPGKPASRILGIYSGVPAGQPEPPPVNDITFRYYQNSIETLLIGGPRGLFTVGNYLFVADTGNNRIVRYEPVDSWAPEGPGTYSPRMSDPYTLFGQDDYNRNEANGGIALEPSAKYLDGPVGGVVLGDRVFVIDSRNHRVLVHSYNTDWNFFSPAMSVLGQMDFPYRAANLISGREFGIGAIALDYSNPDAQRLYIADTANHRILGFADARKVQTGDAADLVIGQVDPGSGQMDFNRSTPNSPGGDPQATNGGGLVSPYAVAVDAAGNLWVADTFNGRVLRFPRPFDNPSGPFVADLVIGQPDFTTRTDGVATRDRLFRPVSITFTYDGHLVVSDAGHHRVLLYRDSPFSNGQAADVILGQPDGTSSASGSGPAQLNYPASVAIDPDDRLYVADRNNGRVSIFNRINTQSDGADAAPLPISAGRGLPVNVTVSSRTGQIYVADFAQYTDTVQKVPGSLIWRFDRDQVLFGGSTPDPTFRIWTYFPKGLVLDPKDNVLVVDGANRITMHYPTLTVVNAVNGFAKVAPAMIGLLRTGAQLSATGGSASGRELPKQLADLEVLVNGVPAPLMNVDSGSVRLIVPKNTPNTGDVPVPFLVRSVTTGEVLAYDLVTMTQFSPAVIVQGGATSGQARAYNADGSLNTTSNAISSGQQMTVYLTGYGAIDGLPDDGIAPGVEVPIVADMAAALRIGTTGVVLCSVVSASLDPDEPGVWRLKVKVGQVSTSGTYAFAVSYNGFATDVEVSGKAPTIQTRVTVKP